MPSVTSSVNELRSSVITICLGLLHSLLAVFHAILAFGRDIASAALSLGQALFKAAVGIAGGVAGIIWANLFAIALLAGGYYLYTTYIQKSPRGGRRKTRG